MHKILQNHLLCAFVAILNIDALYAESFCGKNLAIRKVLAFCDSVEEKIYGDVNRLTDQPTDRANIVQYALQKLENRKKAEICNFAK